MRFLDGYEDRWAYALAFGAITSILLQVFLQTILTNDDGQILLCGVGGNVTTSICDEVWIKSLLIQAQTVVASLVCVPHFICISTPYKLLGAICGFGYSLYWVVFYLVGFARSEKYYDKTEGTLSILQDVPIVLCCLGLMARSAWTCYLCYMAKSVVIQKAECLVEEHQVKHVQTLFRTPTDTELKTPDTWTEKLKVKLKPKIFPHFKLPTRIVSVAFVQTILIYYFGINITNFGVSMRSLLKPWSVNSTVGTHILGIVDGTQVVAELCGVASSLLYVLLFVRNYRIHLIQMYKGDKNSLVTDPGSPQQLVVRSLRLPSYQIAYLIWGLLVMFFAVYMIVAIITLGIYVLDYFGKLQTFFVSLAESLSVPAATIAIFYIQVLLVRLFFMQPKIHEDDEAPPLNIDNRRLYDLVSYFFVFNNLVVGAASVLLRTLKSFFLGLIFLGRLDRCLLMKGFETMDPGYMAYVGTLLVDNAHNNPTMRTFCAVLRRLTCSETDKDMLGLRWLPERKKLCSNSRAARRWHLAYTLLQNPDLLPRRKLTLLLTRGMESEDDDDDKKNNRSKPSGSQRRRHWNWLGLQQPGPEQERRKSKQNVRSETRLSPTVQWSMSDPGTYISRDVTSTGYPVRDERGLPSNREIRVRNDDRSRQELVVEETGQFGAVPQMNAIENFLFFQNETPNLVYPKDQDRV